MSSDMVNINGAAAAKRIPWRHSLATGDGVSGMKEVQESTLIRSAPMEIALPPSRMIRSSTGFDVSFWSPLSLGMSYCSTEYLLGGLGILTPVTR